MGTKDNESNIFNLDFEIEGPVRNSLFKVARKPLEAMLAFGGLNRIYYDALEYDTNLPFYDRLLERMNVNYHVSPRDMERIPKEGKVVVVANHPFGGIEGVILASLLRSVRSDSKIMANYILERIPELREVFFFVDPFGGRDAARANLKSMKESMQWLRDDHVLGVFPAGEVAHFSMSKRKIVEPQWSKSIAGIIRKTEAPVLPVFFDGRNGPLFQMLGLIHPRLRTAMLPTEFVNKKDRDIDICIGKVISYNKLKSFESDVEMTHYLRQRTSMLQNRSGRETEDETPEPVRVTESKVEPIIDPVPVEHLEDEIRALAPSQRLLDSGEFQVFHAVKKQIPNIVREIGRLREVTFRGTHEGTGKAIDLDGFDEYYVHLFVWNKEKRELVGAYRIGRTDNIIKRFGKKGLYTTTLFNIKSSLFDQISPALEMGRSFIRPEYQRSFAPLMLLWKGIGHYVVKYPKYKVLFGPVSISSEYHSMSRHLMVTFLKLHNYLPDMARKVRPKTPYRGRRMKGLDTKNRTMIRSLEDVSELVSEFEDDNKGVPILLKQYLKLGGKLLGFNVDPEFSDVLDGLILVDLTKTDPNILKRYMGDEGLVSFLESHGVSTGKVKKKSIPVD
ncbi:GNAT family N-acyltransferase [Balneolales bacterium ANBcel1]|nr:GNAT family N-acyltransferase [Balneolales bacterium ANBcel1]